MLAHRLYTDVQVFKKNKTKIYLIFHKLSEWDNIRNLAQVTGALTESKYAKTHTQAG